MRPIFHGLSRARFPKGRNVHLAAGIFDGAHRGHQAVLADARAAADADGGIVAALTFDPHPSRALNAPNPTALLMPVKERLRLLLEYGADTVILQPFTAEIASLPAEDFVKTLKRFIPTLASVHVGRNFRFGKNRAGSPALLARTGKPLGVAARALGFVLDGKTAVSSTRVRDCVRAGRMEEAARLLGRPYAQFARVRQGKRLGRTLGFPTLNLRQDVECRPKYGVYFVELFDEKSGKRRRAVANYGLRPTVAKSAAAQLEAHVLGDCPWTAGDTLRANFLRFSRPEKTFASLSALKAQIARDKAAALAYFKARR